MRPLFSYISLFSVACLTACSTTQYTPITAGSIDASVPAEYRLNSPHYSEHDHHHTHEPISKDVPTSFFMWMEQGNNKQAVAEYYHFLVQNKVAHIVPTFELLRTARDWRGCGEEYAVPDQALWHNSIATLKVVSMLINQGILTNFEVTSGYRNSAINQCVGGARSSRHILNAAIDIRIGSANPSPREWLEIENSKARLCQFWAEHGEKYNMGVGIYKTGQIHIDTVGFRTWGPDFSRATSPCYVDWLRKNPPITTLPTSRATEAE